MPLARGQLVVGRFALLRPLGAGGMAEVWLAEDVSDARSCALKLAPRAEQARADALRGEYRRLRVLDHPNAVRAFELLEDEQLVALALEHLPGPSFEALLRRPPAQLASALLPIAAALEHAHARGVVHRDLKPANIVCGADGQPRLADFGVAGSWDRAHSGELAGFAGGSRKCMSPQQLAGEAPRPTDDVYGFGCLLYELITGTPPLGPEPTDAAIRERVPEPLGRLAPHAPPGLAALVDRMLEKHPARRPADMGELRRALEPYAGAGAAAVAAAGLGAAATALPAAAPAAAPAPPTANSAAEPAKSPAAAANPAVARAAAPPAPPPARPALQPRTARTAAPARAPLRPQPGAGARSSWPTALLFAVLLALTGVVFFGLPQWVSTPAPVALGAAAPVEPVPPPPASAAPPQASAEQSRARAEQVLARALELQEALETRGAELWAGPRWEQAREPLRAGDERLREREWAAAEQSYTAAVSALGALLESAPAALTEQLAAGARALEQGEQPAALRAFEAATKLAPDDPRGPRGLARAKVIDQLQERLRSGAAREAAGELEQARAAYLEARALDAQSESAQQGAARVGAALERAAYQQQLTRGFERLAQADFAGAREAFRAALARRPDSAEAKAGLTEVEQLASTRAIEAERERAREHERAERWEQAAQSYRNILKIDAQLSFASEGVARSEDRAALASELTALLAQPSALFDAALRERARRALALAAAVTQPGAVLEQQQRQLEAAVREASTPIAVVLESDMQTDVSVLPIGSLGRFTRRELALLPGRYTLLGSRDGYRDVREDLIVEPGPPPPPRTIRTQENVQ